MSYHGQALAACKDACQAPSEEQQLANAQAFLELVGSAAARAGVPALVGGDWGTSFGFETRRVPASEDWEVQVGQGQDCAGHCREGSPSQNRPEQGALERTPLPLGCLAK